jgi:solute carrier family 25 phosphate transporter 3
VKQEDEGKSKNENDTFELKNLTPQELLPLWSGFAPTVSRELPFAVVKFLVFDIISVSIVNLLNSNSEGAFPIQVGVGPVGLAVSAAAGAIAGVAGAVVSHPADLILTKTNSVRKKKGEGKADWREVVRNLTSQEGGFANLFVGLGARATFFFLVIGLQFFLYDYVKNLFQVGQDDLSLVLDVFYAVREGLVEASEYRSL